MAESSQHDRLQLALAGRYQVERQLGVGGMATVYLAEDLKHRRKVAVKVLKPELAAALGAGRFLREIEIAARLQHPHILTLIDSGESDGLLYYVMPYVEGESLRARLTREGELPIAEAVRILRDVADALAYAHSQGVVHRDIKPDNVLLSHHHAVVTDFGVAKAVSEATRHGTVTSEGVALGTPTYMAPEQAAGSTTVDHRADIYAIGVMAYELLTGRPPFSGTVPQAILAAHVTEPPRPVTEYREHVPPPLAQLVMRCLEKKPADRWQRVEELVPQLDALLTPSQGLTPTTARPFAVPRARRWRLGAAGAGVAAVALAAGLLLRAPRDPSLEPDALAVAPFDVLDPALADLWREGLTDLLSERLDGAGPLRTVSPSVVVRRWTGRADRATAAALGRSTGAGFVVYGRVVPTSGDSIRLTASVLETGDQQVVGDIEIRDVKDRLDRVADSVAMAVLRQVGRVRPVGVVRLASLGSTSLPAVREYLRGEQAFRRAEWDSALAHYERALELDSTFVLAMARIPLTLAWAPAMGGDFNRAQQLIFKAAAMNRGLAPRESLLLVVDSIEAAIRQPTEPYGGLYRRLFNVLRLATERYPTDPQVWHRLGDAMVHMRFTGGQPKDVLDAFDRAIALDSGFAPPYSHAFDFAMRVRGPQAFQRYARAYLKLNTHGPDADAVRLLVALLDPRTSSAQADSLLATTDPDPLWRATFSSILWADTGEVAIRIARSGYAKAPPGRKEQWADGLASALAYRGHLPEAAEVALAAGPAGAVILQELALFDGVVPRDSTEKTLRSLTFAGRWRAQVGDTAYFVQRLASLDTVRPERLNNFQRAQNQYSRQVARAYLALARRDSATALQTLLAVSDTTCPWAPCVLPVLTKAQLLVAARRDREAQRLLDQSLKPLGDGFPGPVDVVWVLERARVNERLGHRDRAIEAYSFVAEVWRRADDRLRPFVEEAREALARLGGER